MPYAPVDDADRLPFRPDFTALIYPAYLCDDALAPAPEFRIDSGTPPAFMVQAEDDQVRVENSLGWFRALKQASVQAELHIFAEGRAWLRHSPQRQAGGGLAFACRRLAEAAGGHALTAGIRESSIFT